MSRTTPQPTLAPPAPLPVLNLSPYTGFPLFAVRDGDSWLLDGQASVDPEKRLYAPQDMPILADSLRGQVRDEGALPEGRVIGCVTQFGDEQGEPFALLKGRGLEVLVTLLEPGTVSGSEWNRTPAYIVAPENPVLIECWNGTALVYLQHPDTAEPQEAFTLTLTPGEKAVAPPGWGYQVSNIGQTSLVFAEFDSDTAQAVSDPLEPLGGLAHYVMQGAGGSSFSLEVNRHYRTIPAPRAIQPQDAPALGLKQGTPFLSALKADPSAFTWLTRAADREPGNQQSWVGWDALNTLYAVEGG